MSLTYDEAAAKFARAKDPVKGDVLNNATRLTRVDATSYAVTFHATRVVSVFASGAYQLATGGYRTKATRAAIERYAPVTVTSRCGRWYAGTRRGRVLFTEGLVVDKDGRFTNALAPVEQAAEEKRMRAYDRLVRRYLDGWRDHVRATKEFPDPGPGDCWLCLMLDPKGERVDHLVSHLHTNYFVPALLWRVLVEHVAAPGPWEKGPVDLKDAERVAGNRWATSRYSATRDGTFDGWLRYALRRYFRVRKVALLEAYGDGSFTE